MNAAQSTPPQRVPTLTEVVAWPEFPAPAAPSIPGGEAQPTETNTATAPPAAPADPRLDDDQLAQRVLAQVQRQVDLMLEYRLREVLTPLLSRLADSVVREARTELASALRDVVDRAVAQELARHRTPQVER